MPRQTVQLRQGPRLHLDLHLHHRHTHTHKNIHIYMHQLISMAKTGKCWKRLESAVQTLAFQDQAGVPMQCVSMGEGPVCNSFRCCRFNSLALEFVYAKVDWVYVDDCFLDLDMISFLDCCLDSHSISGMHLWKPSFNLTYLCDPCIHADSLALFAVWTGKAFGLPGTCSQTAENKGFCTALHLDLLRSCFKFQLCYARECKRHVLC